MDGTGSVIEIGDFDFDGDGQSGDNFALGIHLAGTYDDVWVHDGKTGNFRIGVNDPDYTDYWNTLATGGGATYDDRTRVVYAKVRPVLKTADFLAATPVFVGGLRLLDGNYAGPLIQVRRVDTGATKDIYPTSSSVLDTAAIATHCGSAVGTGAIITTSRERVRMPPLR